METLYVIPARGGSKGLPGKNIKSLNGKPLIHYSIEAALQLTSPGNICVSTDDPIIKNVAEEAGVRVPFVRFSELATDTAPMDEVLRHAIKFYEKENKFYDTIVLLQPTSPLRSTEDIKNALSLYHPNLDMVMSVFETKANPYYVLFEETGGLLVKSKEGNFETRQSAPKVYQANGAIYIINVNSLKEKPMKQFSRTAKYEMDEIKSIDIDTPLDFEYCEFLISKGYLKPL
ncbi:MAG: acylneuraminate cytidylyltransferase family protein [Bacteroidetes bacterium]|nr:acylneuraminate cytidylyltransferase family protein [Bacteroidota bacterium]